MTEQTAAMGRRKAGWRGFEPRAATVLLALEAIDRSIRLGRNGGRGVRDDLARRDVISAFLKPRGVKR